MSKYYLIPPEPSLYIAQGDDPVEIVKRHETLKLVCAVRGIKVFVTPYMPEGEAVLITKEGVFRFTNIGEQE